MLKIVSKSFFWKLTERVYKLFQAIKYQMKINSENRCSLCLQSLKKSSCQGLCFNISFIQDIKKIFLPSKITIGF